MDERMVVNFPYKSFLLKDRSASNTGTIIHTSIIPSV
jgi:hypothetical protein